MRRQSETTLRLNEPNEEVRPSPYPAAQQRDAVTLPALSSAADADILPADPTTGLVEVGTSRSLRQIAWSRLRRDRLAMASGMGVLCLVVAAVFAPVLVTILGHPPNEFHENLVDPNLQIPIGRFGGIGWRYLFGIEPINGRDLFSRIIYGARISLLVAFAATLISVTLGTLLGLIAGYYGGWIDGLVSRIMDVFLSFPLLLLAIALAGVIPESAFGLSGNALRIATLIFIIGFFNWPYIGRIIRGQTLSLRRRDFVEAAQSLGARPWRVMVVELLPNLWAPILVCSTLLVPTNILFEAGLSFLGVGVRPPTPTWGGMLSDATHFYQVDPWFVAVPGCAIFLTVLACNLFGDGLRDALDPKSVR